MVKQQAEASNPFAEWPKELPAALTSVAVLAGVVVYGLLATAYDKFYAELGLTPSDVGLEYGKALGGAAALSVLVVLFMSLFTLFFWWAAKTLRNTRRTQARRWLIIGGITVGPAVVVGLLAGTLVGIVLLAAAIVLFASAHRRFKAAVTPTLVAGVCGAAVTFFVLTMFIGLYADAMADRVKDGGWVEPPAAGGMVFFSVRAMPTTLIATSDSGTDHELVKRLNEHRIRFLGQANGVLVVYDADTQRSMLFSSARFQATVLNCETSRLQNDPTCAQP